MSPGTCPTAACLRHYLPSDCVPAARLRHCPTAPPCHPQVAERSLFLWNNEYIVQLVAQHRETVLPLVIGALEHNAKHHWNPAVHRCVAAWAGWFWCCTS